MICCAGLLGGGGGDINCDNCDNCGNCGCDCCHTLVVFAIRPI